MDKYNKLQLAEMMESEGLEYLILHSITLDLVEDEQLKKKMKEAKVLLEEIQEELEEEYNKEF